MLLVMLPEQILAVVVSIGGADDDVHVSVNGSSVRIVLAHADGTLVIEFDENDGAMDAVVENGIVAGIANPGEASAVEVGFDFVHADSGVSLFHVTDIKADEIG